MVNLLVWMFYSTLGLFVFSMLINNCAGMMYTILFVTGLCIILYINDLDLKIKKLEEENDYLNNIIDERESLLDYYCNLDSDK